MSEEQSAFRFLCQAIWGPVISKITPGHRSSVNNPIMATFTLMRFYCYKNAISSHHCAVGAT